MENCNIKKLINRAFSISPNECLVEEEIKYVKNAFCTCHQYPEKVVDNIIKSEREWHQKTLNQDTKTITFYFTVSGWPLKMFGQISADLRFLRRFEVFEEIF